MTEISQKSHISSEESARLKRMATYASLIIGSFLIITKFGAWLLTGSVTVLASLADSIVDTIASLIALFSVHLAIKPADKKHRYGHGKAEGIGALFQAGFVGASGIFVGFQAVDRLITPQEIPDITIGISIMVISIVLSLILVSFQHYVIKKTDSFAIEADAAHYLGDLLTNFAVIISLIIYKIYGVLWVDPVFGIGISAYLIYNAYDIAKGVIDLLMDKELPENIRGQIKKIILEQEGVEGVHDLRTRHTGLYPFAEAHIEMDGSLSLNATHDIVDEVENALAKNIPNLEILLHQDPVGVKETRLDDIIGSKNARIKKNSKSKKKR